jgi:hypothetical protein
MKIYVCTGFIKVVEICSYFLRKDEQKNVD